MTASANSRDISLSFLLISASALYYNTKPRPEGKQDENKFLLPLRSPRGGIPGLNVPHRAATLQASRRTLPESA